MEGWRNWSGSVTARPSEIARPRTEAELQALVARAGKVRAVGAGHSFMPLCETDGVLVCLEQMEGGLEIGTDRTSAVAPAGWSLERLTAELWRHGLSLANQGDVNPQALAGALATGTHGTGQALGSLSTLARRFRLVCADGEVRECSPAEDSELFEAQRLSLGLLGVATRIEIQVMPAYWLEERIERRPLDWVWANFEALSAERRHAEFFVFPYADEAIVKTLHPTEAVGAQSGPGPEAVRREEAIFRTLLDLGRAVPPLIGPLQRILTRAAAASERTGPAHEIFPSVRSIPFEEMEYELPRGAGLAALREAIRWIRRSRAPVAFPFEFRHVAADDIWLSPFNRGPGASISMHQYARMDWRRVLADGEAIFRAAGGRPHWGKRHTLSRQDVDDLYPQAERFRRVRRRLDPAGKFLNAHLEALFS